MAIFKPLTYFENDGQVTAERLNALVDEIRRINVEQGRDILRITTGKIGATEATTLTCNIRTFQGVTNPLIRGIILTDKNGNDVYVWPEVDEDNIVGLVWDVNIP